MYNNQSSSKYFRITAYEPNHDFSIIMDTYGMFEKLWQFSSFVIQHGCKILEVSTDEKFIDINIERADENNRHVILRACSAGKPNYIEKTINGITYNAVEIKDKQYIPER